MRSVANTALIYEGVKTGPNLIIEDFCLIGVPFLNSPEHLQTCIGNDAIIRAGTYIYAGNIIGKNFTTGNKVNIRENNNIGDNVSIGTGSIVEHQVIIENNVRVHSQVFIPEYSTLRTGCWIGPNVL